MHTHEEPNPMSYVIYGDDGEHTTELGDPAVTLTNLDEAKAAFKALITETRAYNLERSAEEEGHEWYTFYIELLEVDEDGETEWDPIECHVFADDDENPPATLVSQWEELNS